MANRPHDSLLDLIITGRGGDVTFNNNICTLILHKDLECNIEIVETEGYLYFYSPLLTLERAPDYGLLVYLMKLNRFGRESQGGNLGLDEIGRTIIYSKRFRLKKLDKVAVKMEFIWYVDAATQIRAGMKEFLCLEAETATKREAEMPSYKKEKNFDPSRYL